MKTMTAILAFGAALTLAGCGDNPGERALTGGAAGAVVGGPVGAVAGRFRSGKARPWGCGRAQGGTAVLRLFLPERQVRRAIRPPTATGNG
ncbi:MAG TPA: hypothetical protein PLL33_13855 [Paracoccus sp. (in: a-proteobacteria)]|nr:hypothetical protein [Paracoccus sp. (in: a-proteobacteria)]